MRKHLLFLLTVFFAAFFIMLSCKSQPPQEVEVLPEIVILEPTFEVTSIFIIQADIVVTEFEAVIRIINPNEFALELSSITYELFGNNRFWAGNTVSNIFQIPASSTSETRFRFEMNFINMSRPLLDDVIAMRQVNYRFKGQAAVRPVLSDVSSFTANFDCTGLSEVRRRANRD